MIGVKPHSAADAQMIYKITPGYSFSHANTREKY